jgi:predicted nuclease with TOPRIM domain
VTDSGADPDINLPSSPPPTTQAITRRVRSEYEFQVEKNKRLDEVEPGLTQFRGQRRLHIRQLEDIDKKRVMVMERIDKMNADVEKLRQQWGDLERDKAGLLESQHRYEQKKATQEQIVHKDDVIAKKYHDYLTLDEEVLVLDDSDDENEDDLIYDWGGEAHRGGGGEQDQN